MFARVLDCDWSPYPHPSVLWHERFPPCLTFNEISFSFRNNGYQKQKKKKKCQYSFIGNFGGGLVRTKFEMEMS